MEAGKERLTRDSVRDSTQQEVQALRRENLELKQLSPMYPWRSLRCHAMGSSLVVPAALTAVQLLK